MIFVDEARIFLKAGNGGQGCESHWKQKYMRHPRPDGGDGGRGGDVVFLACRGIHTLLDFRFKQHYKAKSGGHASSKGKTGRRGEACILRVPVGTLVIDQNTGLLIKDLVEEQQSIVVVKGGEGGLGNLNKKGPTAPSLGEERTISLQLKLLADVGIVGFPNAGKSTLISNISRVKSKIANYPFTTKQPILGMVCAEDFCDDLDFSKPLRNFIIADLPGIIEQAHQGKGLGLRFLRHAERTRILVHVIDMAAVEGRDPLDDYEKINYELRQYSDKLGFKYRIVVANKMDLPQASEHLQRFKKKYKEEIIAVSSLNNEGLDEIVHLIRENLCEENSQDQ